MSIRDRAVVGGVAVAPDPSHRDPVSDVRAAVEVALPLVRERAHAAGAGRRLPEEVVRALRRTGLYRLLLPTELGGAQAPVVAVMDVLERIAAVDGSTAWCAMIGAGSNAFAGYLPESGARRVFADPDQGNATMLAPVGRLVGDRGRLRLSGRWPFASNCLHSAWIGLGALSEGPDPTPRMVFVDLRSVTVEDTWDAVGLRATGSHHVSVADVPVADDEHCATGDRPWPEGPLWRLPLHTVLVPLLASVPLGIARGALDHIAGATGAGSTGLRGRLVDDPVAMSDFAVADTRLRAARAALREAVAEALDRAEQHEPIDQHLRARIFLAGLHAGDVGVETTSLAHRLSGAAAAAAGHPVLRALTDVQAARQHLLLAHRHRPELGRAVAGNPVRYPPFLP
ncbi:acyl-CoA dehydrogenase family protein [Pseudonocardia lacus]|uniref:acyl-CoA dehydrogenase family protein n=1 Tax=Pseudonocardia lacus TaxID=2835865 RepID=UPI001BDD20E0|nr:acyl-CoA dehydrogenase family protein [Pseudonocardia lacus]